MTVQEGPTQVQYEGNGVTTIYIFQFQMLDASHIRTTVDGEVLDPSEYTVTLNDNNIGGQVEYNVAPADGVEIFIARDTPENQLTVYPPYTPLPAEDVEFSLDKLTMNVQELETESGLTDEEIEILRALFEALDIRVTQNTDDIDSLEIRVTVNENGISNLDVRVDFIEGELPKFIDRAGDAMDGQLKVLVAPQDDLDAISNIFMRNFITALIEGLVLLGFYDASGNVNPVDGDETGEFYIIALGGTLNVSDGINAPTPTLVNVGDYIIWSDATQAPPLDEVWVHIPRLIASAAGVSFDPTGTEITQTNVQDALVEVDGFLVHRTGSITESIDGFKTFTTSISFEASVRITSQQPINFLIDGETDPDEDGSTRLIKGFGDVFTLQQRIGGVWESVLTLNPATTIMEFLIPPTAAEAASTDTQLIRKGEVDDLFDGLSGVFVDRTTNQDDIDGDKGWLGDQSVANTVSYFWLGTGAGGGAGNDANGTFRTFTDGSDITQLQKRDETGTSWVDIMRIRVSSILELASQVQVYGLFSMRNAIAHRFFNDSNTLGLGTQQMVMTVANTWSHQWHDGGDFEDRHRIFEDGSQQFDGECTFNNSLSTTSLSVSGTSGFNGVANFISNPTCAVQPVIDSGLANKAFVDTFAFGQHRATEAIALQDSIDNANRIFYADAGS